MIDKDSFVIGLAAGAFGGVVRWYLTVLSGGKFKPLQFCADVTISAVMGYATYWIAVDLGYPASICAAAAGFAGNVGSRLFEIANRLLNAKVDAIAKQGEIAKERKHDQQYLGD